MSELKVKIYTPAGQFVGFFLNPTVEKLPESEYEITGRFYDENGDAVGRVDFNPEALPYTADLSELKDVAHGRMVNVYVQRGRQPVRMTGLGAS